MFNVRLPLVVAVCLHVLSAPLAAQTVAPSPTPAAFSWLNVGSQSTASKIWLDGQVEAVRQAVLMAQTSGRVLTLQVKAGDKVSSGQTLIQLDDREANQQHLAAQSNTRSIEAQLVQAEANLTRTQKLVAQKFMSPATLDGAEAQVKALRAQREAAQANTQAAGVGRSYSHIAAPFSGIVASTHVVMGDMAAPGKPLLTVYEPGALRVTAHIPERMAAQLKDQVLNVELSTGQRIEISQWQLLPAADPNTHTRELRLPVSATGLLPGQFARVALPNVQNIQNNTLNIPVSAIVKRGEVIGVYVRDKDGSPRLRQIRIAQALHTLNSQAVDQKVEVLSGLKAGEHIASHAEAASRMALAR
jgi:membrane fusion protein, multidrug efflux system